MSQTTLAEPVARSTDRVEVRLHALTPDLADGLIHWLKPAGFRPHISAGDYLAYAASAADVDTIVALIRRTGYVTEGAIKIIKP